MADEEIVEARALAHRRVRVDITALCLGHRAKIDVRVEIHASSPVLGGEIIRSAGESGDPTCNGEIDGVIAAPAFYQHGTLDRYAVIRIARPDVGDQQLAIDPGRRVHLWTGFTTL